MLVDEIIRVSSDAGLQLMDQAELRGRAARHAHSAGDLDPTILSWLNRDFPQGLYIHQFEAIRAFLGGHDVCIATPTASGKSLVFQVCGLHLIASDSSARVLALYPAKALIRDQLGKWRSALRAVNTAPGYIDGAVPVESRSEILRRHRVILMTPDVAHAWLLSNLQDRSVRAFLDGLRLVVLDEAHVYDGVFGTNMAYFTRRLEAVAGSFRFIVGTATLGKPEDFMRKLVGREALVLDAEADGSEIPPKHVLLMASSEPKSFTAYVTLLRGLRSRKIGPFLAFADSRRMVEQLVSACYRSDDDDSDQESSEADPGPGEVEPEEDAQPEILPYRAGYEERDRQEIQRSLEGGHLAGVVSTSALELGLDIGDIATAVLLGTPPSVKAFWQRAGRCGRRQTGVCIVIDHGGVISALPEGLQGYLERPPEPNWLYLDNRYVQFAHALCAASEASGSMKEHALAPFETVPPQFIRFLENELNPKESVPEDLYALKQRAQAGPQYEFPLRSSMEKEFVVRGYGPGEERLGRLTLSQALREAYPGAIYYYMARPYRVAQFRFRDGVIRASRAKRWTTRPTSQNMVFPKLPGGVLTAMVSEDAFLVEAELQVSERVLGFVEQRGPTKIAHEYGIESPYSRRPLQRFFETTGVCWFFPDSRFRSEAFAQRILDAFCLRNGIQARDLGLGVFYMQSSPLGHENCRGVCIYDGVAGSLRLTESLVADFEAIVSLARQLVTNSREPEREVVAALSDLGKAVGQLQSQRSFGVHDDAVPASEEWTIVIAPGSKAMLMGNAAPREVRIEGYRYTPSGLMYVLETNDEATQRLVAASVVVPINGVTTMRRYNLYTGETAEIR